MDDLKIRAEKANFDLRRRINLFAFSTWEAKGETNYFEAKPLELEKVNGFEPQTPFITIDQQQAQVLMDDLWSCGLRPTEGAGSAGSLKATQNHLDDFRKIAFKLLKM